MAWAGANQLGPLASYVVTPVSGAKILSDTPPPPGARSASIVIVACRGEYEPASIVLRAGDAEVLNLTLVAGDLIDGRAGRKISGENLDIRVVKPWFQGASAWNDISKSLPGDFRQSMVPELLLKDDSLVITDEKAEQNFVKLWLRGEWQYRLLNERRLAPAGQALPAMGDFPVRDSRVLQPFNVPARSGKQVWFTLFVPADAAAGDYSGEVQVRSAGVPVGTIPVLLQVLPFDLLQPRMTYSIYYRAQLDPRRASIGSEFRNAAQMANELADMRRHGIRNPGVYQGYSDRKALEAVFKLRSEAGIDSGPLYYLGIQTTADSLGRPESRAEQNLRQIMPALIDLARRHGFGPVYVYGKDEAKGAELTAQLRLWRIVHESGGKVFVAGYTGAHALVGNELDVLVHYGQPDIREAERWHAGGKAILSYANPQAGPENPLLFRLNYGLVLWANNYDGAMLYAYQHCFGSCWNDVDHPVYRDHNLTYPTVDGVIPTIAWEGLREAVDDVRYVTTLEALISGGASHKSVQTEMARAYLQALKEDLRNKQRSSGKYNQNMVIDLDDIRRQVIRHLGALSSAEKVQP